jgi:predicted protein tyrosine phosphatase
MIKRNQLGVIHNSHQGKIKKVLTVCSAGCLRSPTAAHILSSDPWNYNTRCVGASEEYAIVPVTEALIVWADVILVMNVFQQKHINDMQNKIAAHFENMYGGMYADFEYKQVIDLDIDDNYGYRDPELVRIMTDKFNEIFPI